MFNKIRLVAIYMVNHDPHIFIHCFLGVTKIYCQYILFYENTSECRILLKTLHKIYLIYTTHPDFYSLTRIFNQAKIFKKIVLLTKIQSDQNLQCMRGDLVTQKRNLSPRLATIVIEMLDWLSMNFSLKLLVKLSLISDLMVQGRTQLDDGPIVGQAYKRSFLGPH